MVWCDMVIMLTDVACAIEAGENTDGVDYAESNAKIWAPARIACEGEIGAHGA